MLSTIYLASALLSISSSVPNHQDPTPPQWIWSATEAQDDQDVYFLRDLDVEEGLVAARFQGSCDNSLELFLNGTQVIIHDEWETALRFDVSEHLLPGQTNRIAINGWNQGGPAGLWLSLELEYEDGRTQSLRTDAAWRATTRALDGWQASEFAADDWPFAVELGELGTGPWGLPRGSSDGRPPRALEASDVQAPPGFDVELVYNVPGEEQGSWVSLAAAPGGDLFASDQYGALYLITPSAPGAGEEGTHVEALDVQVGAAQGLLWAFDALYVIGGTGGSGEAGLYRVTDSDGDGALDHSELLRALDGSGEHGPHAVLLAPDGESLLVVAGNHTTLPELASSRVPQNWGEDQLLARLPDPRGHAVGVMAPGGWVCQTDPDGAAWELVACGMRNAYDMALDANGELFTFDSDMEWDVGLPWYRPTRVLHLVSGADYGWRNGSGKWPASYPDSWPAVVDVGLGSPTGVVFAPQSWGAPFGGTLLVADWAYGQVFSVELKPQGATYTGTVSEFMAGKPFPVTDLVVVGDVLYVTTGGRQVQSGLYRLSMPALEGVAIEAAATGGARAVEASLERPTAAVKRKRLEAAFLDEGALELTVIWSQLVSSDPFVRRAARVSLEHRPLAEWQARAQAETQPQALLGSMLALVRCAGDANATERQPELAQALYRQWGTLAFVELTESQQIEALRVCGLIDVRIDAPAEEERQKVLLELRGAFPSGSRDLDRELCRLLVAFDEPYIVPLALGELDRAATEEDRIFYFHALRNAARGWTPVRRETYFRALQLAIRDFSGGASLTQYLRAIRGDAAEQLSAVERVALSPYMIDLEAPAAPPSRMRRYVRSWTLDDLTLAANELDGRDFARGAALLDEATCLACHRFGGRGGNTGPDLAGAGNRFGSRDLLEAILLPSKQISDQYQDTEILTRDDEYYVGRIEGKNDQRILLRSLPPEEELLEFALEDIAVRSLHSLSRMPSGLLDTYERDEVLDLLAALIAGPPN